MRTFRHVLIAALACLAVPASAHAASCPTSTDAGDFATASQLRKLNKVQSDFGERPTGSKNQADYVDWLERQLKRIPGITTRDTPTRLDRWDLKEAKLTANGTDLPVAAPVPYSRATGAAGVTAPLVALAETTAITADNSKGRIIVRERPYSSGASEVEDIRDASDAGAVAIVFASDLAEAQLRGYYRPYEGVAWRIPGVYTGADESARLRELAATGASATLTLEATTKPATTRMVTARLPGRGSERIIVQSHTDGMNAVWDNGPIAMIAMARHLADLPKRCRPRTIEFVLTTAHLYQSKSSADRLAEQLDARYDRGGLAAVVSVEHFGARRYAQVPRAGGAPGIGLRRTSDNEVLFVPVSQSDALTKAAKQNLTARDVDVALVASGLDAAVPGRVPANCNFGGEGNPYHRALLPTVGAISGSQVLFTPGHGLESVDFDVMRSESLAFTDLVLDIGRMKTRTIAGDIPALRRQREAGAPGCENKSFAPRPNPELKGLGGAGLFCTLTDHRQ